MKKINLLNTRPEHQSHHLTKQIVAMGGTVFSLPIFKIHPVAFLPVKAGDFDQLIFSSANAVQYFFASVNANSFCKQPIVAIGSATQKALFELGLQQTQCPEHFSSEGLLAMSCFQHISGKSIGIICGENPKSLLETTLLQRGARVETIFCYRRKPIAYDMDIVFQKLLEQQINVIVITSGDNFTHLLQLFEAPIPRAWLLEKKLCVISEALKDKAVAAGFHAIVQAKNATDEAVVEAII